MQTRLLTNITTALAAIAIALLAVTIASPSYAATLTVCAIGCNDTTIAAAIAAASAGDTISIEDAVQTESDIVVDRNLTIKGQGAANTAVDGGASGSVFIIDFGVTATIQGVTIRKGSAFEGGGILNFGTVTISNSTLSGNTAVDGGGISNHDGTLTISDSTLSGNSAGFHGGGINNFVGTATISNSTLSGNSAVVGGGISNEGTATISSSTLSGNSAIAGGGIFNEGNTVTISNSTLSGNSAAFGGTGGGIFDLAGTVTISNSTLSGNSASVAGGIFSEGTVTISNSTLSGNSAAFVGGIFNIFNTVTVKNSIIGNSAGGDCLNFSAITGLGANLDTDGSCGTTNFTAVTSAQLNLGPLALNAPGTTETLALLPGSGAINAAPDCTDVFGHPVTTDQRGVARPDSGESACDIGAFELVDQTPFASFSGKLEVTVSTGGFGLNSNFTLGAGTNGINPATQPVTLQIGPYSVTIPAGSFQKNKQGAYVFSGVINGVSLSLRINPVGGGNSYTLQAEGSGANLGGISNPVTVTLTIGNDTGSAQITAQIS